VHNLLRCRHIPRMLATPLAICFILSISTGGLAQSPGNTSDKSLASGLARVLQVGSYQGKAGGFSTIQAAVNAALPGDWILIAPGTYHEKGSADAGVLITTPGIHLRGMDRNGVVVDGTNPGFGTCSSKPAAQDFSGRNGIEIVQVDGVSVENLTVCNFLGDNYGNNGNEIWWNGGDGSGQIGMGSYSGAYLTASSTFYQAGTPNVAQYGIFVSNAKGPGAITYSYASNMGDSAFYVGACADCNMVLRYVHAQNSPQGYSGTNAGGHLVLEDSEWDHNQSGIVPSSLANDDPPSPQDGACPDSPGKSCTLIQRNWVHDNNNPNAPANSLAATVPVGTGIDLSGGRNNTVQYNLVTNNGSWGILLNDYADYSGQTVPTYCQGGIQGYTPVSPYDALYSPQLPIPCYFPSFGNRVTGNVFLGNGFFGNETNGDLANAALPYPTNNCFRGNIDLQTGKPTSSPLNLQSPSVAGTCGAPWNPDTTQEMVLTEELGCASLGLCSGLPIPPDPPPSYPGQTYVKMMPIPHEKSMADPCQGVPRTVGVLARTESSAPPIQIRPVTY
jgi:parallel beta-helix repeat protein